MPKQPKGLNAILADQTVLQAKKKKPTSLILCTLLFDPYVRDIILTYVILACQFFHVLIKPTRQKEPWGHQDFRFFFK